MSEKVLRHTLKELLLLEKEVNWSLFEDGLDIGQKKHELFFEINQEVLPQGQSRKGKFLFEDRDYAITFMNSNRKGVRSDTIHIRYDGNNELKDEIMRQFQSTYQYFLENKKKKWQRVKVPEELKEYLWIYSTGLPYHYRIDFITVGLKKECQTELEKLKNTVQNVEQIYDMSEEDFQKYLAQHYNNEQASYETREALIRHRKYRNTLVNDLKKRYNNTCQICKFSFKDQYGKDYSEGHHIKPFSKSEDHSPENLIILCPNHHRIIHKAKPDFDRKKKAFIYPDTGLEEKLQLNDHL